MSLDFKLHYDRLKENDPTNSADGGEISEKVTHYDTPGHARNLCLVWPDGRRHFLSYTYLISGTFNPGENANEITLNFTAYIITIKGYLLEKLFVALLDQLPKQITQMDMRYITKNMEAVAEIMIQPAIR